MTITDNKNLKILIDLTNIIGSINNGFEEIKRSDTNNILKLEINNIQNLLSMVCERTMNCTALLEKEKNKEKR